jgi:hypothetical protein
MPLMMISMNYLTTKAATPIMVCFTVRFTLLPTEEEKRRRPRLCTVKIRLHSKRL